MLDPQVVAKLFYLSVPKLRAIVTPDLHNTRLKFILSLLDKNLEDPDSLTLVLSFEGLLELTHANMSNAAMPKQIHGVLGEETCRQACIIR